MCCGVYEVRASQNRPVGYVRKDTETFIEILPEFREAMEGLRESDWIKLVLWFRGSDTSERRSVLKVPPYFFLPKASPFRAGMQ